MSTLIKSGPNADVVHYNATRREDYDRFLAAVSRNTVRAEATARFNDRIRVAFKISSEWADIRRTMIEDAVSRLYRTLLHTEES